VVVDPGGLRNEYASPGLTSVDADPIVQFEAWLSDAVEASIAEPNAMVLATADPGLCTPSARTVLLKGVDVEGFVFYTNRHSRKGRELAADPRAALVFPWLALHRQVIVDGLVGKVSDAVSDAYFATRPRGAQLSAWASRQSEVIEDRATLDRWWAEAEERFAEVPVARPPWWGGYRVVPSAIEFWQGRPNRLHDRLRYSRSDRQAPWTMERLSP
jgi:pyridoxamine 5'-phosphate oxidase